MAIDTRTPDNLVGETQAEFTRISEVRHQPNFDLWILTHTDLRKSARIRTFMRFIGAETETFLNGLPRQRGERPL